MTQAGIDLWCFEFADTATLPDRALALIDESERTRYRQIPDPGAAHLFALRRAARRVILAGYCGAAPASLAFAESETGKPRLVRPAADIGFSASDCASAGILAVVPAQPVGADLELPRSVNTARLAERILSPAELASYQRTPAGDRPQLILRAWTAKEALVKATGTGMDLAAFRRMTVLPDDKSGTWRAALGPALPGGWMVWTREMPAAGAQGALVSIAAQMALPVTVIDATTLMVQHGLN